MNFDSSWGSGTTDASSGLLAALPTTISSVGSLSVVMIIALVLGVAAAIVAGIRYLGKHKIERYTGFQRWLCQHLNFDKYLLGGILKVLYVFGVVYAIVTGIGMLFVSPVLGLVDIFLAPIALRLVMEVLMLLLSIREEAATTNQLLRRQPPFGGPGEGQPMPPPYGQPDERGMPPYAGQPGGRAPQGQPPYGQPPMRPAQQGMAQQPRPDAAQRPMSPAPADASRQAARPSGFDSAQPSMRRQRTPLPPQAYPTMQEFTGQYAPVRPDDQPPATRPDSYPPPREDAPRARRSQQPPTDDYNADA